MDHPAAGHDADEIAMGVEHGVEALGEQSAGVAGVVRRPQQCGDLARGAVAVEGDRGRGLQLADELDLERVDGVLAGEVQSAPGELLRQDRALEEDDREQVAGRRRSGAAGAARGGRVSI
ncbi:hypothetical protein [Streptomyces sp. NPDC093984]|uniref:hypothetical protein n=1 Tax=Streptomyces sp. NPDC093984 TaxID=3366052 RepID=UPI0038295415